MRRISSLYTSYVVWFVLLHLGPPHCDVQFLDCDDKSKEDVFKSCELGVSVRPRSELSCLSFHAVCNKVCKKNQIQLTSCY